MGGNGNGNGSDPGPLDASVAASCEGTRTLARRILETNCAVCHQSPAKHGNFDFCLDEHLLTTSVSSTGKRFVVPGAPEESRLYQRVFAREMPPAIQMQRPSAGDITVLRDWINGCVMTAPRDAGVLSGPDGSSAHDGAGAPIAPVPPGCGNPGQECCDANLCQGGGCCVVGQCHAEGQACGDAISGLPGRCAGGSCVQEGVSCGAATQPCCAGTHCTAPRAYCGKSERCEVCGDLEQPCCGTGGSGTCLPGMDCQGDVFPNPGSCLPCGALGQPCCGNGVAALQKCDPGLICRFVPGMDSRCRMP